MEIIIKDFCNSTDLLNQIKSQATKIGFSGTLPLLQLNASGYSDGDIIRKKPFKQYIITTTAAILLPFLQATQPLLIELIKKDYRQEITIKTKNSTIQIKTYQDINKVIDTLRESEEEKGTKDKDDNFP